MGCVLQIWSGGCREIDWFQSGKNKGKKRLGVLEKERERMKRGLTPSEEEADQDTWSFL